MFVNLARNRSILLTIVVFGCGPGSTFSDVSEQAVPSVYAEVVCDHIVECDCPRDQWIDRDSCVNELTDAFSSGQARAIEDNAVYDSDCLSRRLSVSQDNRCFEIASTTQETCLVYHGDQPIGATCQNFDRYNRMSNCSSGLICNSQRGVCEEPGEPLNKPSAEGEQCVVDGSEPIWFCDATAGLFCDENLPAPACSFRPGEGQSCAYSSGGAICQSDHYCDDDGICRTLKLIGVECNQEHECESRSCSEKRCSESVSLPDGCSSRYLL